MSDHVPQILIVEPSRRGRRRSSEPGSTLSIWLPASEHEYYAKLADARGESVSMTVKTLLQLKRKQAE